MKVKIQERLVGEDEPTYFIADIAANHDGELDRAFKLIELAKANGADAAKFQHFKADKIVSDYGFKTLGKQVSHQSNWKKSVYEVYKEAEFNRKWDQKLYDYCRKIGIHYFSSPYDFKAIDELNEYVPAYKIGSGDINWSEILIKMARKRKPIILSTGASTLDDVITAATTISNINKNLILLQCNTNYTASTDNFKSISLNVLKTYSLLFPDAVLGLSDHTLGNTTVLGAIALGARVIEKHFTDDNERFGPDHKFAMNPQTWREMVERTRELEMALGGSVKKVEDNEKDTIVVQRRCLRAAQNLKQGHIIRKKDVEVLRPAPAGSIVPNDLHKIIGKKLLFNMDKGKEFTWEAIC